MGPYHTKHRMYEVGDSGIDRRDTNTADFLTAMTMTSPPVAAADYFSSSSKRHSGSGARSRIVEALSSSALRMEQQDLLEAAMEPDISTRQLLVQQQQYQQQYQKMSTEKLQLNRSMGIFYRHPSS